MLVSVQYMLPQQEGAPAQAAMMAAAAAAPAMSLGGSSLAGFAGGMVASDIEHAPQPMSYEAYSNQMQVGTSSTQEAAK